MRLLLQRVRRAEVRVEGVVAGSVGPGLCVLAGFGAGDGPDLPDQTLWDRMLTRMLGLRVFPRSDKTSDRGRLDACLADYLAAAGRADGGLLLVPQFTLYADCRKGRRPSFSGAARPGVAEALFDALAHDVARRFPGPVGTGVFAADMEVELVNWGPVTIWLDSDDFQKPSGSTP